MSDRTYVPRGDVGNAGNRFDIKCFKCGVWYNASCHWHTVPETQLFVKRDALGNRMFKPAEGLDEPVPIWDSAVFPRIKIENISPHECKRGKGDYDV